MATHLAVHTDANLSNNGLGVFTPSEAGVVVVDAAGRPSIDATIEALPTALSDLNTALATPPEVPASPDAQDIVDALVTLGLITQAAGE